MSHLWFDFVEKECHKSDKLLVDLLRLGFLFCPHNYYRECGLQYYVTKGHVSN